MNLCQVFGSGNTVKLSTHIISFQSLIRFPLSIPTSNFVSSLFFDTEYYNRKLTDIFYSDITSHFLLIWMSMTLINAVWCILFLCTPLLHFVAICTSPFLLALWYLVWVSHFLLIWMSMTLINVVCKFLLLLNLLGNIGFLFSAGSDLGSIYHSPSDSKCIIWLVRSLYNFHKPIMLWKCHLQEENPIPSNILSSISENEQSIIVKNVKERKVLPKFSLINTSPHSSSEKNAMSPIPSSQAMVNWNHFYLHNLFKSISSPVCWFKSNPSISDFFQRRSFQILIPKFLPLCDPRFVLAPWGRFVQAFHQGY